ncbi:MAG: hypothetical protein ACK5YR_02150 [Pirellula sp.]|jgi:hypothetical protein
MNFRVELLQKINEHLRGLSLSDYTRVTWLDGKMIRDFSLRMKRGDGSVWVEFLDYVRSRPNLKSVIYGLLEQIGWAQTTFDYDTSELSHSLAQSPLANRDQTDLLKLFGPLPEPHDERPKRDKPSKVMYIEEKPGLAGHARIGRVTFSKSWKTIYYQGRRLQTLSGSGYKANYFNLESGLRYWISNCKKDGNDTLYPGIVEIDDDVREEYWVSIRNKPECVNLSQIRSAGKYSKRRPR